MVLGLNPSTDIPSFTIIFLFLPAVVEAIPGMLSNASKEEKSLKALSVIIM